ncbi:MAG: putative 7-carboxy-7-deazaguanine synthase QueE [Clostridia bacterium]|jgi:7-carboxy-7-deazaguanine synthase|nr:putative 7-carboxy-7-deazaguanine synthase QueE [Clostridia bacterium]
MSCFKVAEKFVSINGEGPRAGEIAVFLRFCGCNLNCSYCDTRWANTSDVKYEIASAEEIVEYVKSTGVKNVTLTGGEPLLQADIARLIVLLGETGAEVEIETNGSVPLKDFVSLSPRPAVTADYKLPSSGMEKYMLTENFSYLTLHDAVKFVVGDRYDLARAEEVINKYGLINGCRVYFSPVFGKIKPAEIAEFLKERKLNGVRLQLQLHKIIWEPDMRGV